MTTIIIQRDKSVWLLFIIKVLLSVLFAFINVSELMPVGVLQQTSGYPFGGEGPTLWYYKTLKLYATVSVIIGLLFFSTIAISCCALIKVNKTPFFATLFATLLLTLIQILNEQPT